MNGYQPLGRPITLFCAVNGQESAGSKGEKRPPVIGTAVMTARIATGELVLVCLVLTCFER